MVRIAIQLIFLFLSNVLVGQLVENFSDNNLSDNVIWKGNVSSFFVDANQRLRLSAPAAGSSFLYTDYAYKDSFACAFTAKLEFNPSGSNFTRLYFLIDNSDLSLTNGYFVQLGENGTEDAVRFYKVVGGQNTLLGSGQLGTINKDSSDLKLAIRSNGSGRFTIEGDHNKDGVFEDVFIVNDLSFKPSIGKYFGIQCVYSSTRKDKFAFDDISIESINTDVAPPLISSIAVIDPKTIKVLFNEPIDKTLAEDKANYQFSPSLSITKVSLTLANEVTISLTDGMLPDLEYELIIKNIKDSNANIILPNANKIITNSPIKFGDIVLSELLFDPFTNQQDFVELFNNTSKDIDLKGYRFSNTANGQEQVVASTFVVKPKSFVALSPSITSITATYTPPIGSVLVMQNLPSMNNDRGNITIHSADGTVIDSFSYTDVLHTIDLSIKNYDGVSLEKIDLVSGKNEQNWMSSELIPKYATPGYANSRTSDLTKPIAISATVLNNKQIVVTFNDILNKSSMANTANYNLNNGIGQPFSSSFYNNSLKQILLTFEDPFSTNVLNYSLSIKGVKDKNGNEMETSIFNLAFVLPPQLGDLVLSEILYYPTTGMEDFIELYNSSDKNLQLGNLQILNTTNQQSKTLASFVMGPKSYVAISKDTTKLRSFYSAPDSARFFQNELPAFNIDEGNVTLALPNGTVLDSFNYNEDLHHTLIDKEDLKGISLEKIILTQSINARNWHSAAKGVNYATPGYKNSSFVESDIDASAAFTLSDKVFTPDGDGDKDLLILQYKLDEPGFIANAKIFSADGYLVKDLAKNELLGTNGILKWDGSNNEGVRENIGIYIIIGELFSTNGTIRKFKLSCVLALP